MSLLFRRKLRGAGTSGEAESTRIRLLQEAIIQANVQQIAAAEAQKPPTTCLIAPQPIIQDPTTPNQLTYILDRAVRCPILYATPFATSGCQPVYTVPIPPLTGPGVEPPQGPAVVNVYRKFPRIGGIDEISKPFVRRSSNDRTARLRAGIESQSQTRYVQTVLPLIPYPVVPPPAPQPGVPVAPITACAIGTRRVDYSSPVA